MPSDIIKAKAVPDVPSITPPIVTMRAGRQERMMLTLIRFIVFTSDDLDQFPKITVFAGGK